MFGEAMIHLQTLEKKISSCCGNQFSSNNFEEDGEREVFLGQVVASILRESGKRHGTLNITFHLFAPLIVWLYRDDQDEHFKEGLTLLSASCQTALSKVSVDLCCVAMLLINSIG
jgi:hypothetical protein